MARSRTSGRYSPRAREPAHGGSPSVRRRTPLNFLAHLLLADRAGAALAGAVLGDVVRGRDLSAYPPALAASIQLHRRIDALTDRHPLVCAARARFAPGKRRYAGIVLDLLYDHALAQGWDDEDAGFQAGARATSTRLSHLPAHPQHESLAAFARRAAESVAADNRWFLHAGARAVHAGEFAALLLSYRAAAGIELAIARVARRLREPQRLLDAAQDWHAHLPALAAELPALLADLARATVAPRP